MTKDEIVRGLQESSDFLKTIDGSAWQHQHMIDAIDKAVELLQKMTEGQYRWFSADTS